MRGPPPTLFTGWGPALDRVYSNRDDPLALPQAIGDPIAAALLLPACTVASALDSVTPTPRAAVVGEGLLADLTSRILNMRGFSLEPPQPGADLGLVVDTTGDSRLWAGSLPALRSEGTLLLLVPPWARPVDFDFYPHIHRRSLTVVARRWHRCPQPADQGFVDSLGPIVSSVVSEGRWLRPFYLKSATVQRGVWQWLDWTSQDTSGIDEKR